MSVALWAPGSGAKEVAEGAEMRMRGIEARRARGLSPPRPRLNAPRERSRKPKSGDVKKCPRGVLASKLSS